MGLNTTHNPRQLSAGYAVEANNVLLSEGRIRPRAPFVPFCVHPHAGEYVIPEGGYIAAMVALDQPYDPPSVLAQVVRESVSSLWRFDPNGTAVQLATGNYDDKPWSFVQVGKWHVVLTGGVPLKTNGEIGKTFTLGLPSPVEQTHVRWNLFTGGNINATVRYAVTWCRTDDTTESNPVFSTNVEVAANQRVRFEISQLPDQVHGINVLRVYRRNISLGQVAYRLVATLFPLEVGAVCWDPFAEEEITLSSPDAGPFAPSRNGLPPHGTQGKWFKNRLFVIAKSELSPVASRVYYSGLGEPGHFFSGDWLDVSGDGSDRTSGLIVHAGQLVIGKPRSIWVLSGGIQGPTNLTAALGAMPPVSNHTLHRTKATIGPINTRGQGFVMAGDSPAVHFAADGGFFAFDGVTTAPLSTLIKPTWDAFLRRKTGRVRDAAIVYALDPANGILYMTNVQCGAGGDAPQVLAYHFRGGLFVWTTLDGAELPHRLGEQITSIASALGDRIEHGDTSYAPLLVAGSGGSLRICRSTHPTDAEIAPWSWKTGRLTAIEGKQAHIYAIEWFLAQSGATPGGSPLVRFGFLLGAEEQEYSQRLDAGERVQFDHRVGAMATDITLTARSDVAWTHGWKPELGILGFSIDAEVAGKR